MKHDSRLSSLVRLTSLSLASAALALGSRAGTLNLAVRGRAPEQRSSSQPCEAGGVGAFGPPSSAVVRMIWSAVGIGVS